MPLMSTDPALYRQMARIRHFEQTVLDSFPKGLFYGTTHTYIGQEANAVGVLDHLHDGDIVFSNHRCHGHFIAYGGDLRALFAELMGKATGVCGGLGGSQHLHWKDFYSNGVLGSTAPVAVGAALAEKAKGNKAVTVIFLGDGALGEGVVYESLNLASLWNAPILFVLENNHIAQTTPVELALAGSIPARFAAFDIPCEELDSSDVQAIHAAAGEELAAVRSQSAPRALVISTVRFGPHSKGDDTRDETAMAKLRAERDPLTIHSGRLSEKERNDIEAEVKAEVAAAFEQAVADEVHTITAIPV
jgi:TPP-dependent pyruvate/acetoin dehydrogenase alpha subunit